jgi:hypothetical protein
MSALAWYKIVGGRLDELMYVKLTEEEINKVKTIADEDGEDLDIVTVDCPPDSDEFRFFCVPLTAFLSTFGLNSP